MSDNGAIISAYKVLIRHQDTTTFSEDLTDCNGAQLVSERSCQVPFTTLMGSPWNLQENTSIYARIIAINEIGESDQSNPGNGATLVLSYVPDVPFGLSRDHQ